MHLDEFSFDLPASLIAQEPCPDRAGSRLLVAARAGDAPAVHATFRQLPGFLRAGDLLVVNRTRVVPARLAARRADGVEFEVFYLRTLDERRFSAWARPMKKLLAGDVLDTGGGACVRFVGRSGEREAVFEVAADDAVETLLDRRGHVPLPPYIHRADRSEDRERYQTVFARERGSVAAPTAGLHFDPPLLAALGAHGVEVVSLWLHVGPGTFQPLDHDEVEANRLHAEPFAVDAATIAAVARARAEKRRVVAVGTTVTRALETAAARGWLDGPPIDRAGETDLFIYPGRAFRAVDALVTNFHLPRSSLFILVCAFMGTARAQRHYAEAVARGYRFFSYGDAMLIG